MYRRSVDSGNKNQKPQTIDFQFFKRKDEISPNFQKVFRDALVYKINDSHNIFAIVMVISALLTNHQLNKKKGNRSFFHEFGLKNSPKQYQNYNHPNTLEDIFRVISNFTKTDKQVSDMINNYPISLFILNCVARCNILNYLQTNTENLDLMGNQQQVAQDYELQLRGNLLEILAKSLGMQMTLNFFISEGKDPIATQRYGESQNSIKLNIDCVENSIKWEIREPEESFSKLTSIYSSQNFTTIINPPKRSKQTQIDTTDDGQSVQRQLECKSANKEQNSNGKCLNCRNKICQCRKVQKQKEKEKKQGITPRPRTNNNSILDGLNFGYISTNRSNRKVEESQKGECKRCQKERCVCRR